MTPAQLENAIGYAAYVFWWRARHIGAYIGEPDFAVALCHVKETNRRALISLARSGCGAAHDSLCGMANFLTALGDPLPLWLQDYVVAAAQMGEPRRSRGRDPWVNFLRDVAIGQAVGMVTDAFRLKATRNEATTVECGCSIVAIAINRYAEFDITEANVVKIWRSVVDRNLALCERGSGVGQTNDEPLRIEKDLARLQKRSGQAF
jgi:hypothetical protein